MSVLLSVCPMPITQNSAFRFRVVVRLELSYSGSRSSVSVAPKVTVTSLRPWNYVVSISRKTKRDIQSEA